MIIAPSKKLIVPPYKRFRSLDEAMRKADDGHSIDLWATVEVKDPNGFSQGRTSFRCHSFLKQFIDYLVSKTREGWIASVDWAGNSRSIQSTGLSSPTLSFDMATSIPWQGPCVGTGLTAPTINDYKLEKPVWHGTGAANLSVYSGTATSTYWTDPIHYVSKTAAGWTVNAFANMTLAYTSGAANGWEGRIDNNTATLCYTGQTGFAGNGNHQQAFPTANPGATPTFVVKNYGQLTYSTIAISVPTDDGALQSKFSISRDFTNNQGGNFTVNECGLHASMAVGTIGSYIHSFPFLIVRDVLGSPVTLANGQIMTLTYNFICNA